MSMNSSTELAVPAATPTKTVSVLPYEYWGMQERWQYARALAAAKDVLPRGIRNGPDDLVAARVFLIFETGAMLGLHPLAALQGIDIIEGQPAISPQLFTGLARSRGVKLRERIEGTIADGTYEHFYTVIRPDDPEPDAWITRSFGIQDAVQAGLCKLVGEPGAYRVEARSKDNAPLPWENYTKDMIQWRALGRVARAGAADVTKGIGYFPEELQVAVTSDGEVVRDVGAEEDTLIARIRQMDDKADLALLWGEHNPKAPDGKPHPDAAWTQRVDAELAAQLARATKDTRPPKQQQGAPGNTGDPDLDGANVRTGEVPAEPPAEPVSVPRAADARAMVASAPPAETLEEIIAREAAEADAAEARRWEAEHPTQPGLDLGPLAGR